MAIPTKKITELTPLSSVQGTDKVPVGRPGSSTGNSATVKQLSDHAEAQAKANAAGYDAGNTDEENQLVTKKYADEHGCTLTPEAIMAALGSNLDKTSDTSDPDNSKIPTTAKVNEINRSISELGKNVEEVASISNVYLLQNGTAYNIPFSPYGYLVFNLDTTKQYVAVLSVPKTGSAGLTCGIQYFDSLDNFLGFEVPGTASAQLNVEVNLNVPQNASYCRIASRESGISRLSEKILIKDYVQVLKKEIDAVSVESQNKNGVVYNYNLKNISDYASLIGYDLTKVASDGYVPDEGWSHRVTIDKYIVADDISTNYEVSITDQPVIVVGSIDSGFSSSKHATLVKVDFSAEEVSFLTGAEGGGNMDGNTIPEYSYDTYELENISGTEYRIEVGRKNRCPYVKIYNLKTSQICCDEILSVYETDSSYGGKGGAMYDFPVFGTLSGTCCYKRVFCNVFPHCDIVFLGDSITEGSQLAVTDVWANKIINSDYVNSGLNCGRGGGNIDHVLRCLSDIVSVIDVKLVVVTIGTNGGNTQSKLEKVKELVESYGAKLILNCIPMLSSGYPSENTTILGIDAIHCRFDIATSINNDVSQGQNANLFASDRVHPNINGGVALYNNFMANVGSIIKI